MSAFDIKIEGFDRLMKVLENRPEEMKQEISAEFEAAGQEVADLARQRASSFTDQGQILQSISYNSVSPLNVEVICQTNYAAYQEFGTRGKANIPTELSDLASQYQGATGRSFQDLLQAILGWVRRKGIAGTYSTSITKSKTGTFYQKGYWNGNIWVAAGAGRRLGSKKTKDKQDMEAAYPIALSIVKNGIPAQPFFFPGFFEVKPKLIERIKNILIK